MRRTELKNGDGMVNIDLQVVRTLQNNVEVNTYAGREMDTRYYFPCGSDERSEKLFNQTFERLVERDLKHALGKVPSGDFTEDDTFVAWTKEAIELAQKGRGIWVKKETSDRLDKNGAPYVNIFFNKTGDVPPTKAGAASPNKPAASPAGQHAAQGEAMADGTPDYAAKSADDDDDIPF